MFKKESFPLFVLEALQCLQKNGFEAYVVGGCLRDLLLNIEPKDWDIATNAIPLDIKKIFLMEGFKVISVGERFGTISVIKDNNMIEITTYRTEGKYQHFRAPQEVIFVNELKQDLLRRDFTMNALACDPLTSCQVIDYFDGLSHIKNKQIVCVGNPRDRLLEDALRILRAVRFVATKGFELEIHLQACIIEYAYLIQELSCERITAELNEWLLGEYAAPALRQFGWMLKYIFKNKKAYSLIDMEFAIFAWERLPFDLSLRLSALLLFCTDVKSILKEDLRHNNLIYNRVLRIIKNYPYINNKDSQPSKSSLKRYIFDMGADTLQDIIYIKLQEAHYKDDGLKKQFWQEAFELFNEIQTMNECCCLKTLNINGQHLLKLGAAPKEIKYHLSNLLFAVFDGKVDNDLDCLQDYFLYKLESKSHEI